MQITAREAPGGFSSSRTPEAEERVDAHPAKRPDENEKTAWPIYPVRVFARLAVMFA